jgi:predicted RNA-binding Zn-ribbon protein involved in translation (DUF1610 family)
VITANTNRQLGAMPVNQTKENNMKILEFDIETMPHEILSFQLWNQTIRPKNILKYGYTGCFAAKWHGKRGVKFYSAPKDGMDGMVQAAWDLLDEADAVVHYNGARFDVPTLNKEFIKIGLLPPRPYHQIDLIKTVRQEFRFPGGNSLDEVLKFLNMQQKVSHKGIDLWKECMTGDVSAWRTMERYNKRDVTIMEALYNKLLPWIRQHPNHALYTDTSRPVCGKCGSDKLMRNGTAKTKTMIYQRYQCKECGSWMRDRVNSTPRHTKDHLKVPAA